MELRGYVGGCTRVDARGVVEHGAVCSLAGCTGAVVVRQLTVARRAVLVDDLHARAMVAVPWSAQVPVRAQGAGVTAMGELGLAGRRSGGLGSMASVAGLLLDRGLDRGNGVAVLATGRYLIAQVSQR